jgi:hypothetical protein
LGRRRIYIYLVVIIRSKSGLIDRSKRERETEAAYEEPFLSYFPDLGFVLVVLCLVGEKELS